MARRITVDFEDGSSHTYENAPDDMTPEVATQRAMQDFGKKVIRLDGGRGTEPPAGFLESTARDLASSFGMGASLAPRAASFLLKAAPGTEGLQEGLNSAADSAESYWKGVGDKSTNNAWGQKALRGVGGALTTGPASVVNAVAGAGAGIGDEVAGRFSKGNPSPLLRIGANVAGGLLAGTGAALATRARPQTADVAREAMEGLSPEQLNAAQQYKNQLAAKSIDIDLAQALQATSGHSGNLGSVRDFLSSRVQGNNVQRILRAQPEQLNKEAALTIESLPGDNWGKHSNSNFLQKTATNRLAEVSQARSDLWEKTLNDSIAAGNGASVPGQAIMAMHQKLLQYADKYPNTSQQAVLQELQSKLTTPGGALNDPLQINQVFKEFTNKLKSPSMRDSGVDVGTAKYLGKVIDELRDDLGNSFKPIRDANTAYKSFTESTVNPLRQGPVGTVAQPSLFDPSTQAMVSKFSGLMNDGSDRMAKTSEIATLAKELSKTPEAFESAFKGWLSEKLSKISVPGEGANPLPTVEPAQLFTKLFKTDNQWQGLKDATAAMADVYGMPRVDMVRGLENLRQMTVAMANRPAGVGGMSPSDLKQMGSASNTANLVRVASFLPVNRVGEAIERVTFGKTLSQLDTILTSPEGAKMLIELGKVPVMSRKAQVILGTWGGAMGNTPGLSNSNPPE